MLHAMANQMRPVAMDADDIIACLLMALFKRVIKKVPGAEEDLVNSIIGADEWRRLSSSASRSVSILCDEDFEAANVLAYIGKTQCKI